VRYPIERLAKVCPFFEGMLNVPQPPKPQLEPGTEEKATCPFTSGAMTAMPNTLVKSPAGITWTSRIVSDEDEENAIELPVTWGGLRLCLELVDAHITCPALGGSGSPSTSSFLRNEVEEHLNAMIETAHVFGLSFVGNHVYRAFAGQPVPARGGASDPLWIFAVVAATGCTDVLVPAAWNTLRPDFNIFGGSLQGKHLLRKFARDELRELNALHHAWHYALQVYDDAMLEFNEWEHDGGDTAGVWESYFSHGGCPHPRLNPVAQDAARRVKEYLYSHPVRSEQTMDEIIDSICDPVTLTDVIVPSMGECDTCIYAEGGLLDSFERIVQEKFVQVLKQELQAMRYFGTK
jgi:hypothetical protein